MRAAGSGPFGSCADIFESCIWSQIANIDPEVIKPFSCSPFCPGYKFEKASEDW